MISTFTPEILLTLRNIANEASKAILEVYDTDFREGINFKDDHSPLTLADKRSHQCINDGLVKAFPDIPVMSEEGSEVEYSVRKHWKQFWCVDPLDGTKEFIKKNGQFTINIALIEGDTPIFGLIHIPVLGETYWADASTSKAYFSNAQGDVREIRVSHRTTNLRAVGSKSHATEEEQQILSNYVIEERVNKGSALKFCLVAAGEADIYYRHGPTMEWDTAAGQAIVKAAGGSFTNPDGSPFIYNKENLRNGSFLCVGW